MHVSRASLVLFAFINTVKFSLVFLAHVPQNLRGLCWTIILTLRRHVLNFLGGFFLFGFYISIFYLDFFIQFLGVYNSINSFDVSVT